MTHKFNPLDLTKKVILITGASGGIGSATAKYIAKLGAVPILHFNSNEEKIDITIKEIEWEENKFDVQHDSITELEKLYKMLDLNKDIKVEISGHTDSDGNDQDNMVLSENRAQAVVDWLVEKGISSSRLSFKGYGETKPIVDNSSKENKAKNRRTELTIK